MAWAGFYFTISMDALIFIDRSRQTFSTVFRVEWFANNKKYLMDYSEKKSKQANNRTGRDYPQQDTVKYHLRFHWLLEVGPLSSIHHVWEKYIIKEFPCILSKIRTYNWLGMLIDPEEAVGNLKVLLHDSQFFKHQSSWKLLDVSPWTF